MKLAVVTTTFNRPEHFRLFLEALKRQKRLPDEILAADDGSDEPVWEAMREMAAASGLPVKWARQPHEGFRAAAARNAAMRLCQSDYVVGADCDIVLMPEALETHERLAERGHVVLANRSILDEAWTKRLMEAPSPVPEGLWEAAWEASDKSEIAKAEKVFRKHAILRRLHLVRNHKPKFLSGSCGVWMDDMRRVNGFDENFVGWGYEDDDLGRRLHLAGVKPKCGIGAVRAMHIWHPSLAPQGLAHHRERPNRAYFYRRGVKAFCENGLVKG